ncbi:hypothetical protein GECvBMG_gp205c [Salmonella phage GEC_vB_MG]|nr:hypothetical protein GECvBMG_gp205c [Salmonella phage GEC_vB_MG]
MSRLLHITQTPQTQHQIFTRFYVGCNIATENYSHQPRWQLCKKVNLKRSQERNITASPTDKPSQNALYCV